MRITESPTRLTIADTPTAVWTLGAAFVGSGLLTLSVPITVADWAGLRAWERAAVLAIGASHLAGGMFTIGHHPATRTEMDRATGLGTHRVRRAWRRPGPVETPFPLADVRAVEVVRSRDSDGDPAFQLRLWLVGSRRLWLQAHPANGEAPAEERAARVRRFLGLPSPGVA